MFNKKFQLNFFFFSFFFFLKFWVVFILQFEMNTVDGMLDSKSKQMIIDEAKEAALRK